ncbi:sugar ABC transporter substrate-binding protein [Leptothoe spongobia]|uniref:Extracellular solute-binding protein n=1 Tax=Leptothoe spongobia TAU-MAC 1115 TaxID=1967444 RepID=A0A947GKE0_9CYAN|nr:extracellular solute-binding protein [Leptothoe spongobia]MBT9314021.1 extracellular solute-binding protein [Leptothoe spongobia TAU-MAC 1115]
MLSVSLLFITACSSLLRIQPETNQTESLQGQILLWVELPSTGTESQVGSIQQVVQSNLEDFNKLYPHVKVFVEKFPFRQIQAPLKDQIQRGAGPDLLSVRANPELIDVIKSGLLRTVDETDFEASQFRTEALKNIRYQGKTYGLPLFLTTQVLCYNKTKVETLPNTLAEIIQQARQGYSVGLMSGFLETYWGVGSFGGTSVENQNKVNVQQWRAWSRWLQWLKEAQNEPNFILSDDNAALRQAFLNGQLAYLGCRSDWLPDFSRILDKETLGVTLLPGQPNQPASPIIETGIIAFSQASSAKQHQLALRLAQFLTNIEQQKRIEAAIPFIPSNKLVTINPQLFPIRATLQEQSKNALAISLDEMEQTEAVVERGNSLYQKVLAGELSPNMAETEIKATVRQAFGLEE